MKTGGVAAVDAEVPRPGHHLRERRTTPSPAILAGKVKAGDVVVIRYEGPKGGPGMQEMLAPTAPSWAGVSARASA